MNRPVAMRGIHGHCPPNMCRAQENRFKYTNKNKNLAPLKMQFSPPNLKTWLWAWGATVVKFQFTS